MAGALRASWALPPGPAPNVVELLESHGVAVIRLPLGSVDVDAFSLPLPDHPVVVLGTDKNDRARSRFDAAHELGHLVMHGDQIWGLPEIETGTRLRRRVLDAQAGHPRRASRNARLVHAVRPEAALAGLAGRAAHTGEDARSHERRHLPRRGQSRVGPRLAKVKPVPLGEPEQPRHLLTYIDSLRGSGATAHLPAHIIDSIAAATAAN